MRCPELPGSGVMPELDIVYHHETLLPLRRLAPQAMSRQYLRE